MYIVVTIGELYYFSTPSAPGWVSDGAVVVHPERGRLGVVGGGPQRLGLVYEHVRHPEPVIGCEVAEY